MSFNDKYIYVATTGDAGVCVCVRGIFMLLPQMALVCVQNIYVATTGDASVCVCVCRIFMLLPQVALVCVQNIYVATTGDAGMCAEHLQTIVPCYHAVVGYHLQSQYLTAMDDTDVHFVLLEYTVEHRLSKRIGTEEVRLIILCG
jgi:hypothetical protein